jgi:hypothetical protein
MQRSENESTTLNSNLPHHPSITVRATTLLRSIAAFRVWYFSP